MTRPDTRRLAVAMAIAVLGTASLIAGAAAAQTVPASLLSPPPRDAPHMAIGADLFASTDADDTDVIKAGVTFDWVHDDPDHYLGVRLEEARFKPLGQSSVDDQRAYLRFADTQGRWKWNGQIGSDGDTALGAFNIHKESRLRPEFFVEREIVETPIGVDRGLYYTFVGGAFDVPLNDRNTFTVVAGVQDFTGDNVRTHLRVNYVHVIKPEWGLSAQVRTRYFHSSDPGEFDYFSPRWYAEVIPVLQVRRYSGGWRYVVAAGLGAQKDSETDWRSSRYFNAQITSPPVGRDWAVTAAFTYSNTPVGSGNVYDYNQVTLGLTRVF